MRRLVCALLFLSSAFVVAQNSQLTPTKRRAIVETAQRSPGAELPVRRVVLYKNGVGYFEHAGRVVGNQGVTIDFTSSQLNDVLQSLTALDLGGGRITGVGYNSTTPLDQQLKNIPLGLDDQPTTEELYGALRGARVEVSAAGGVVAGRVVNYEMRSEKTSAGDSIAEHPFLTMVSDAGAVRTFELNGATSVRVLDGGLKRDLDEYLGLLASTESQQVRHLTLQAQGTGTRDIRVSYISEVPVWKSTYRIVLSDSGNAASTSPGRQALLQGWAVVDNTVGTDWNNVQLSLVAGAPQSFIEPLSQPIYTERPVVPVPEAANVAPTTHEGGIAGAPASPVAAPAASSTQTVTVNAQAVQLETEGAIGKLKTPHGFLGRGYGSGSGSSGTIYKKWLDQDVRYLQDETGSATSSKFDDFFEYNVAQPITIRKNESALVPVLQTNVEADRVTLYNASDPAPLRAVWLTNSGNVTLDRGSFSIFDNGEFAGEGLMDPIHAGEKQLLSYAVDQAVHVSTEGQSSSSHLRHITVHDGYLIERSEQMREVTYVVHNAAPDARTVLVEHSVQNGWKLTSETKPVETTATLYRFSVAARAGETERLRVAEAYTGAARWQLTDLSDDQLQIVLTGSGDRAAVEKALAPVLAARAKEHELDTQIDVNQKEMDRLTADQKRLHDNLAGLKDTQEEKALARRYAGEMNSDEDQLDTLKKQRADLDQRQKAAAVAMTEAIRGLNLDEDV